LKVKLGQSPEAVSNGLKWFVSQSLTQNGITQYDGFLLGVDAARVDLKLAPFSLSVGQTYGGASLSPTCTACIAFSCIPPSLTCMDDPWPATPAITTIPEGGSIIKVSDATEWMRFAAIINNIGSDPAYGLTLKIDEFPASWEISPDMKMHFSDGASGTISCTKAFSVHC